jgi:hypothetical protein
MYKYQVFNQYPGVFVAKQMTAIKDANGDLSKIDPLYTAPQQVSRDYIMAESLPPGDPYASQLFKKPEVSALSQARSAFYQANPIQGQTQSNRPVASPYAQQQMNAGNWNDPQVKQYLQDNNNWKAQQLAGMGLSPLSSGYSSSSRKPFIKKSTSRRIKAASVPRISLKTKGAASKPLKLRIANPMKKRLKPLKVKA